MNKKLVEVVAAVIENENNEIAIYSYKGDYIKTLGGQNNE